MEILAKFILKFIKGFAVKYFGTVALEKIVIEVLRCLVKRTDSDVDNRIFEEIFGKVDKNKK